ncbi:hydroxymethylpyrimidine/phosphomethylpyrimidine kinase [Formosa sp. PL04]|uniref:hydroxymethylpyrimidine/phosphomethylpyrimidine kinase n=1 Tax=Formosa sp. PL04 TaxID=3081755 RepID=UPI002981B323|nr:hydroxymethylpyrimidine/phosphomethylpyrimidine kinase [Formosa sp. PL04]MDW5288699.1 hydroxymethylpyrimidine/phosphomethylpyrimidine kinase [Formosa sp. PL04]
MSNKTYILTIAGLDPSSGAGITSDIKTFEAHGLYGLSVCTAVTVQNDIDLKDCIWIDESVIINQIEMVFDRFSIAVVKIGIIESWYILSKVVDTLLRLNPDIKIILDPILKASSGFVFHTDLDANVFNNILYNCYFITPNYDEIQELFPDKSISETIDYISEKTNMYLKGGHRKDKIGLDEIYHSGIVQINLPAGVETVYEKHGSGCVLSAALASNFARNIELEDACRLAKQYTEHFLNSNDSLLGTHNYKNL